MGWLQHVRMPNYTRGGYDHIWYVGPLRIPVSTSILRGIRLVDGQRLRAETGELLGLLAQRARERRHSRSSSPETAFTPRYQEDAQPTQPYSDARVSVLREGELPTRVVEGSGFTIRNHREAA